MFICNVKLNKSKIIKLLVILVILVIIISAIFGIYSWKGFGKKTYIKDDIKKEEFSEILPENYTNILKSSHENIDLYIGKKIKFTGFVYRLYDFSENQFVLAREMIISQSSQAQAEAVVVGFLCESDTASSYEDNTWVEIEGTIVKGYYH